ncbi:DUF475 domain-containing protein [Cyanobium sp. HWJ4-Hawea]|uniref:DUF475 domain-containing protein n=1 Tax=unclassified Cyanobium TaxID=2627006 RepID=UPI0020CBB353|nr:MULTISPECIES: DUF475 domain-containing protein [unclassified Cyanobium]MCP9774400.1 DUF475 domain-containing protein [Cyanobium sp. WAJ14-Wanaka]MCP9810236.1 DUF475 domain-containing protein [Cyanobium sp. HWJ4-Hawea]
MEAESIQSISPLIEQADRWSEVLLLLPLLVALEAVLSADNAIALAAIARSLKEPKTQRQALNLGLALALVFRLALIVAAQWVLKFWPLQLLASGYLFWLCGSHLLKVWRGNQEEGAEGAEGADPVPAQGLRSGLGSVVVTLAVTDLAFSLDSVAAAVAVTDRIVLVMAGGVIGVVALRLTAELFIRWLEVYRHLETAGYLAVGFVGLRLLARLILPDLDPPEWALLAVVAALFAWGFSQRNPSLEEA